MPTTDQYTMQDPTTQYANPPMPKQQQKEPGLAQNMKPKPDHGEKSYRGLGRLTDRKALVTGGDSGIGRAAAIAFAREGADVAIIYLPEEQPDADEVIQLIQDTGRRAVAIAADISDETICQQVVEQVVKELGSIDILVNNAGKQVALDDIEKLTTDQLMQTYKTNVFAMFWLTKAALPHMPKGASIINTTSIQAYQPSPTLLDYASTKAAIANFTHGLAKQLAPKGIRVNGIAPGPIWTPLQPSRGQLPSNMPSFGEQTPLGRAGQPAELAPAYVFQAKDQPWRFFIKNNDYVSRPALRRI